MSKKHGNCGIFKKIKEIYCSKRRINKTVAPAKNTICKNATKYLTEYEDATLKEVTSIFKELGQLPRITRDFLEIIIKVI